MSKHTLGPWVYQESTQTIRSSNNHWLATIDSFDGAIDHKANAKLIAKAPELYNALKESLNYLDHGDYPENHAQYLLVKEIKSILSEVEK